MSIRSAWRVVSTGMAAVAATALVWIGGATALGANPTVTPLTEGRAWERIEFRIEGIPAAANPFDPDTIRVDAAVVLPSRRTMTVPAFWYQEYRRSLQGQTERLSPEGAPEWRLRISSGEAGIHTLTVSVSTNGQWLGQSDPLRFEVAALPLGTTTNALGLTVARGPSRVASNRRYFETAEGRPLLLSGACVCWPGTGGTHDYDRWFTAMSEAGENYARLWMAPWAFGIEAEPGTLRRYRLDRAWQLDYVMRLAESQGIGLMLCLDYHGMFETEPDYWGGNNYWPKNPYSAGQGGPCANQNAFFTTPEAKTIYQHRLRYLVARYGYSSSLFAWEFFNELDNVYRYLDPAAVVRWHEEMGAWLHANDPFGHLVTTSLTGGSDRADLWSLPQLDFTQYHSYGLPEPATALARLSEDMNARYGKPVLIGEYGVDWRGWSLPADPYWRGFRQGLWGAALGGTAGTAMSWWWEELDENQAYPFYRSLNEFLRQTRLGDGSWTPIRFADAGSPPTHVGSLVPGGEPFDVTLVLDSNWGKKQAGELAVPSPRARNYSASAWNAFFHGATHADLRNPCRFEAWLGEGASLTLHLNSVSSGAILQVLVDDKQTHRQSLPNLDGGWQVNNEYNTNISVALPAGFHRVEIRNAGADWFYLDWIRVEHALPARYAPDWEPSPAAVGMASGANALLYLVHPDAVYPGNATNDPPALATNAFTVLSPWPEGAYRAEWRDPSTGRLLGTTAATTTHGSLNLPLPPYNEDLAGRLQPLWELRSASLTSEGQFEFLVRGQPAVPFVLETSTNLSAWEERNRGTNTSAGEILRNEGDARDQQRYFRVRLLEDGEPAKAARGLSGAPNR